MAENLPWTRLFWDCLYASVAAAAEESEQIEEEVDEVKVERQRAVGCQTTVAHSGIRIGHLFDLLGVPGCEADENQHTDA